MTGLDTQIEVFQLFQNNSELFTIIFSTVGIPTFGSYFGAYDGPIILQNITCSSAYNCTGTDATHPACNSDRIAGVMCVNGEKTTCNSTGQNVQTIVGVFSVEPHVLWLV